MEATRSEACGASRSRFDDLIARLEADTQYLCEHMRRLKDITNEPHDVEALRVAHLPKEEPT